MNHTLTASGIRQVLKHKGSPLGLHGTKSLGTLITPLVGNSWTSRDSDSPSDIQDYCLTLQFHLNCIKILSVEVGFRKR